MNLRTPNHQKVLFVKIALSFTSLIPCLKTPSDDRENTERRAKRYRALAAKNSALFLRLIPKKVDYFPEKVDIVHNPLKKMHFFCIFLEILTSFSSLLW